MSKAHCFGSSWRDTFFPQDTLEKLNSLEYNDLLYNAYLHTLSTLQSWGCSSSAIVW